MDRWFAARSRRTEANAGAFSATILYSMLSNKLGAFGKTVPLTPVPLGKHSTRSVAVGRPATATCAMPGCDVVVVGDSGTLQASGRGADEDWQAFMRGVFSWNGSDAGPIATQDRNSSGIEAHDASSSSMTRDVPRSEDAH